jgi:hypothetical protein
MRALLLDHAVEADEGRPPGWNDLIWKRSGPSVTAT